VVAFQEKLLFLFEIPFLSDLIPRIQLMRVLLHLRGIKDNGIVERGWGGGGGVIKFLNSCFL